MVSPQLRLYPFTGHLLDAISAISASNAIRTISAISATVSVQAGHSTPGQLPTNWLYVV